MYIVNKLLRSTEWGTFLSTRNHTIIDFELKGILCVYLYIEIACTKKSLSSVLKQNNMQWLCVIILNKYFKFWARKRIHDWLITWVFHGYVAVGNFIPHICHSWPNLTPFILQLMTPNSKQLKCPTNPTNIRKKALE